MAVDKLVDSTQLDADLTSVADAIRTKGGTSADLAFPSGFVSAVEAIPTGGGGGAEYMEATVTAASTATTISFPAGSFELGDYFHVHFTSDVTTNDPNTEIVQAGCYITSPSTRLVDKSSTSYSFCATLKAGSGTDYWSRNAACSQAGNTITMTELKSFVSGGTYHFWIYNLSYE